MELMVDKVKISEKQFMKLVTMYVVGSSILYIPSALSAEGKQDAWMAGIIGLSFGLLLVLLYNAVGKRINASLVEFQRKVLGNWIGSFISLLIFAFTIILSALILRNIGDFMIIQIFPETPIESLHIIFMAIVIMGVRLKLEVIARASEILYPWFVVLFLVIFVCSVGNWKFEQLQPIFENGFKPIIKGAIPFVGFPFMELFIFIMIFPAVNQHADKSFLKGAFIGGCILILLTLVCTLVLGPDITTREVGPTFTVAKTISIAHVFERIEALVAGMWFISIYFKLALCFYTSCLCLSQILNLKDFRFLTVPLGIIIVVLSIIAVPNTAYLLNFTKNIWTLYAFPFGVLLPLLWFAMSFSKKGKAR
jgi:spore germination protein KB